MKSWTLLILVCGSLVLAGCSDDVYVHHRPPYHGGPYYRPYYHEYHPYYYGEGVYIREPRRRPYWP